MKTSRLCRIGGGTPVVRDGGSNGKRGSEKARFREGNDQKAGTICILVKHEELGKKGGRERSLEVDPHLTLGKGLLSEDFFGGRISGNSSSEGKESVLWRIAFSKKTAQKTKKKKKLGFSHQRKMIREDLHFVKEVLGQSAESVTPNLRKKGRPNAAVLHRLELRRTVPSTKKGS